ncbi:MAG: hypothetical protein RLZZ476_456 [Verrucomicrobiota bacterium]|jgi:autotransporter-associated beta strand protein
MKKTSCADSRPLSRFTHPSLLARLLCLARFFVAFGSVSAQTSLFWDQNGATAGTGGTGNWGTANTWRAVSDTGTLQSWDNTGTATANLGGTAGTITIDTSLASGVTMAALNVNTSGYAIRSASGARPLVVTGGVTLSDGVSLTLTQASTDPTWSLGTLIFGTGASLSFGGNATANNSNRISLTTTSTISGGGITLAGTSAGPTGFVASTPSSSPSVQVTLNTNITNNSGTSATMLGANFSNTLTYGGVISGSASLQISGGQFGGSGTVVLTSVNNYTGGTYLNHTSSAVFRIGIADALPTGTTVFFNQSAGNGTLSNGGTLDLAGFNQTLAGLVAPTGMRGVANTGGASTLTLGGSGTYVFDSGIGVPSSTTNLTGANNAITVIKNGSGTQTFGAANSFTGGLYINSGTLRIANVITALGGLPASPASAVFVRGGTLQVDTTVASLDSGANRGFEVGPTSGSGSVTIQVDGSNSFIVQGAIVDTPGGSGRILKTGTGILRLQTTAKTFTGGISVLGGSVSFAIDDRLGAVPAAPTPGNIVLNNGGLLITGSLTLNANRGIALGPESGSGSGSINVGGGFTLTYEGIMADNGTGSGALIKTGAGTLRLQNAVNTYSGGTQILEGDVSVGVDSRLGAVPASPTSGSILLNGGGLTITADMTLNANRGIALGPNSGTGSGTIQVTGTNTLIYAGVIADNPGGSGRLIKTGSGTLRLQNSTNTFTGGLTVNGGLVSYSLEDRIGTAPATPTPASIILNGGGLRLTINNMTINANRGIALGADGGTGTGTLSVEANRTLTYNGIIADNGTGSGALEKVDAGTVVLGGANTYTGGTTLTAGSLLVTNTTGSATGTGAVTTAAGTTLGGTGIIAPTTSGSVILGGSVTPGVTGSASTLTFTPADGNATFQNTSSITFELFGNGNNDKLVFAATGAGLLDVSSMAAGSIGVTFAGGYTPSLGHSFDLLDWSGVSGLSTSLLNLSTAGFDPSWVWDTSLLTTNGTLSIALVPEPSRGLMLMMAAGAVLQRRRRA